MITYDTRILWLNNVEGMLHSVYPSWRRIIHLKNSAYKETSSHLFYPTFSPVI